MAFARTTAWSGAVVLAVAASILGCASSRGAWESGVYRNGAVTFRVGDVPSAWRRLDLADAALAFRDEPNDASILVNGRCGQKSDDVPLGALTNQLLLGTTERTPSLEETVSLDGRDALHTRLVAKLDGVPMAYDVYVLKKDGCIYDLLHVARPSEDPRGTTAFETFVAGFRTMPKDAK